MSSDYPIAAVDFAEARTFADFEGLKQDLSAVAETCTRLEELLKIDSKDHVLVEALWTSALIRYARCFATGKRYGLDESVFDELNGDPIGTHRLLIDIRSKHIAHSVKSARANARRPSVRTTRTRKEGYWGSRPGVSSSRWEYSSRSPTRGTSKSTRGKGNGARQRV